MDELIPVISKLQDVFAAVGGTTGIAHTTGMGGLHLPQIVVLGSQSSGKSSVLENIVGRDFLPRGTGIVTRRPLVLQLVNTGRGSSTAPRADGGNPFHGATQHGNGSPHEAPASTPASGHDSAVTPSGDQGLHGSGGSGSGSGHSASASRPPSSASAASARSAGSYTHGRGPAPTSAAWAEFLHLPGMRFTDFAAVRSEIVAETERLVGGRKNISSDPIHLRIHACDVVNLTLVDLPGITKVPIGDQPSDIEERVRNMALDYISEPTAIILAIIEATSDIANSEALKLAREVDKEGVRTIGVLTKLDLMDAGTDAVDVLQNRVIPLARGFVGVVNRSQKDINERVPIADAHRAEAAFFQRHPAYRRMALRMGSPYLAKLLNSVLIQHARECLPALKARITSMVLELQAELSSLGEPVHDHTRRVKGELLLMLLSKYANAFTASVDGTGDAIISGSTGHSSVVAHGRDDPVLAGGARVSYVFNEVFASAVQSLDPFDEHGLSDIQIMTAIHNAAGTRPPLFVPQAAFEVLVKRQIKRLEEPAMQCVDLVYNELVRIAACCETDELARFATLSEEVLGVVHALLRKTLAPTHTMVSNLIHIELAHINTNHPDFVGGSRAVADLLQRLDNEADAADPSGAFYSARDAPLDAGDMGGEMNTHLPADIAVALGGSSLLPSTRGSSVVDELDDAEPEFDHPQLHDGRGRSGSISSKSSGAATALSRLAPRHEVGSSGAQGVWRDGSHAQKVAWASELAGPHAGLVRAPGVIRVKPAHSASSADKMGCDIIKSLISSYFNIVRKNVQDLVPKTVMCFLVNCTKDNVRDELIRTLYRDESRYDTLLQENDDAAARRATCSEMYALLCRALEIVDEVHHFDVK